MASFELYWIAMRIVTDRQSLTRHETSIKRKRNRRWPLHRVAVPAKTRLTIRVHLVIPAAVFDRTLSIFQRFLSTIPRIHFRLEKAEIIVLMISDGLMFLHAIFHELWRRDVMKFIRIDAEEPIAIAHLLSHDMKHVTT